MKRPFQSLLAYFARKILNKYKPVIIGITGSIGKTSAKEAIFNVVAQKYRTRKSEKNYNNEFGLPLTIIGAQAPGKNPVLWLQIIFQAMGLLLIRHKYPEVMILEMGVDRIGDMDHLVSIAKPKFAVITNIGMSHLEFFKDTEAIAEEKGKIAQILNRDDFLLVNANNAAAFQQKNKTKGKVISYGIYNPADVRLTDIRENSGGLSQTAFTVTSQSRKYEAYIKAMGETHLSATAAACALGEAMAVETDLIIKGLQEYRPVPGRQNIIAGIKRSLILDDSYNAAPDSTKASLKMLKKLPGDYKIAVLGDMLELGAVSDESHKDIGGLVASLQINKLITVGSNGKLIAEGAKIQGMDPDKILSFDTSDEAKKPLQELMPPQSTILIKGSQGVRMEKITKEIMAEPMRASQILCRQSGKWLEN